MVLQWFCKVQQQQQQQPVRKGGSNRQELVAQTRETAAAVLLPAPLQSGNIRPQEGGGGRLRGWRGLPRCCQSPGGVGQSHSDPAADALPLLLLAAAAASARRRCCCWCAPALLLLLGLRLGWRPTVVLQQRVVVLLVLLVVLALVLLLVWAVELTVTLTVAEADPVGMQQTAHVQQGSTATKLC